MFDRLLLRDPDDAVAWGAARMLADRWAAALGCDYAGLDLDDVPLLVSRDDYQVRPAAEAEIAPLRQALTGG